jgi:hypothetical protein
MRPRLLVFDLVRVAIFPFLSFRLIKIALPAGNGLKKFAPKEPWAEKRISLRMRY